MDGLSQQTVLTITQDQQGFLWFGTNDGLNRFDGYSFKVFHASADSSTGLHNDFISRLFCAKDGKVWVGTFEGGVSVYDPNTEVFTTYRHDPSDSSSLRRDKIGPIFQDRSGTMWIGSWNAALSRMSIVNGKVKFFHYRNDP
ncbi:MAG: ligand-binding sensor domain-containing protein, partial [Bacteroidota bacterium]